MEISAVLQSQKEFFYTGETKNVNYRIYTLKKLKEILKNNEDILYEAIYKDFGKSKFETYETELSLTYHEINVAVKKAKKWSKAKKVRTNIPNLPAKSYIIPEPLGNTLVIGAWNYPYQLSLIPLISAIAAGNTVILKPSELSANSSAAMAKLINSNFDTRYLFVYEGGVKETSEILQLKFDKIFFTGSIPVGKIVYEAAAKNLTPVTLELGGKSPAFVLPDCNLKVTAKRIVWGKYLNAGQTCVAPDYILVHESIKNDLLQEMEKIIIKLFPNKTDIEENYIRIINQKHFDRLISLINKEKVYFGGDTNREKLFIYPTILNNVDFADKVMDDEIFGPILPVISYTDLDKIIEEIKPKPKPLAMYVFGKRGRDVNKILSSLSFGGGAVNDTVLHLSNGNLPFGGVGSSGTGNYHEKAGFSAFSHYKSILDKSTIFEPFIKYPPYNKFKLNILKKLLE